MSRIDIYEKLSELGIGLPTADCRRAGGRLRDVSSSGQQRLSVRSHCEA